jgi:hypothetical protein
MSAHLVMPRGARADPIRRYDRSPRRGLNRSGGAIMSGDPSRRSVPGRAHLPLRPLDDITPILSLLPCQSLLSFCALEKVGDRVSH